MRQIREALDTELEHGEIDTYNLGVEAVLYIRCMHHREVPQLNVSELEKGECGACVRELSVACTPIRCGTNPVLPDTRVGCGQWITSEIELFRCVQCAVPFHRECLRSHFGEHEVE